MELPIVGPQDVPGNVEIQGRRMAALEAARRHVAALLAGKNEKGYPRHSVTAEKQAELEIRYARFLLGED